ncbi:hypothetical protein SynA1840_02671 [Synechococcus sp. A18-40]|nr:hypothetical protein SynA1840_02671 [Synechococcus sp. A18-40]
MCCLAKDLGDGKFQNPAQPPDLEVLIPKRFGQCEPHQIWCLQMTRSQQQIP